MGMLAYVGARTTRERNGRGEGLAVFAVEPAGWRRVQLMGGPANPSFLAFGPPLASDPGGRVLYAVHGDGSEVSALRIDPRTGLLAELGRQDTLGRNPVHLALDRTGRFLVVANYATGTVAALPVAGDGGLGPVCSLLALPGAPGPHRVEQACSHPHQVLLAPDGRLIVPDKGLDRTFALACDADGTLRIVGGMTARPGAGPRHAALHPAAAVLYVANELDSSVTTCRLAADGGLEPVQVLPTLPPDFFGASTVAAIVATPCGGFVFVSNRGHDSVAGFAVQPDHTLRPLGWTVTGGATPRFMTLDPSGSTLLVAHEGSDDIVGFAVTDTGALRPQGALVATGSPVCILLAEAPQDAPGTLDNGTASPRAAAARGGAPA